jgi:hypothetical protein
MLHIPEAGGPDKFVRAVVSQPVAGWQVDRRLFKIAEESY